jgi:hypothetical protein
MDRSDRDVTGAPEEHVRLAEQHRRGWDRPLRGRFDAAERRHKVVIPRAVYAVGVASATDALYSAIVFSPGG